MTHTTGKTLTAKRSRRTVLTQAVLTQTVLTQTVLTQTVLTLAVLLWLPAPGQAETVRDVREKMGSRFVVTAVHADEAHAQQAIEAAYAEIDRVEAMISSWRETSVTSKINRNAGLAPVEVPKELFNLVRRSVKLSRLTEGAFDITFASLGNLWDFKAENPQLPDPDLVGQVLPHVGYGKIVLDSEAQTVFLRDPGTKIGFGAIGKGHAANRGVFMLKEQGIESGVVSAGGDLVAFGHREDGTPWDIGVAHPDHRDHVFARLPLTEQAVVTSGDYESFLVIGGERYGHILDPRTGYPVRHMRSVTIVCPDAELADGLATATFVLGPQKGLALIDAMKGVEAMLVDTDGKLHFSKNLRSRLLPQDPSVVALKNPQEILTPASDPGDHKPMEKSE